MAGGADERLAWKTDEDLVRDYLRSKAIDPKSPQGKVVNEVVNETLVTTFVNYLINDYIL